MTGWWFKKFAGARDLCRVLWLTNTVPDIHPFAGDRPFVHKRNQTHPEQRHAVVVVYFIHVLNGKWIWWKQVYLYLPSTKSRKSSDDDDAVPSTGWRRSGGRTDGQPASQPAVAAVLDFVFSFLCSARSTSFVYLVLYAVALSHSLDVAQRTDRVSA